MNIPKLNNKLNSKRQVIRLPKLTDAFPCFILFLAGRASIMGMYPFGTALFCSIFQKNVSYLGILTLVVSGLSSGCGLWTYKYVLGSILFWLYTRINTDYKKNSITSSLLSALCLFSGGVILTLYYPTGVYDFFVICVESVLCAFFYVVFEKASLLLTYSREGCGEQELISAALSLGILITGVSDITLPLGLNLASVLTIYVVMSIALHENLAVSGCGGLSAGFICSMSSPYAISLMGFYGICGIFANLLKSFKKYGIALGFLAGTAISLMYIGNSFLIPISVPEVILSILIFILTPEKIHAKIGIFINRTLHPEIIPESVRMREYLSDKLHHASDIFKTLKTVVKNSSDRRLKFFNRDMCTIFDEVTNRVCRKCSDCGRCWEDSGTNSYRIIFSLLEIMETQGFCSRKNASEEFLSLCSVPDVFLSEFSHVYELYKTDIITLGKNKSSRDLLLMQYDELADFFENLAAEMNVGFNFLPETEKRVAQELTDSKIPVHDVKIIENARGVDEIYVTSQKNISEQLLEEKISKTLNLPIGFTEKLSANTFLFSPRGAYTAEVYTHQTPKDGQAVNGDVISSFSIGNTKQYVIICDGMGYGYLAAKESRTVCEILEIFLKSGFSPKMALNMINSTMVLKSDNEIFSSVDLLCIDLLSGVADFYKIGASKSFFYHEGICETIFSDTLPVGIMPETHVSMTSKRVDDGDIIFMMSDGVSDASPGYLSGERLIKIIEKDYDDIESISKMIIHAVLKKKCSKAIDDMTLAAIKINICE